MYYVYVLQSLRDHHKLYIGRTSNLKLRIKEHFDGKVWTTRRFLPVQLIFYESFISKKDAIRREKYFKKNKGKNSLKQIIRESLKD